MALSPVHRNSLRNFKGRMIQIASLDADSQAIFLKRFARTKRLKLNLEQWLEGGNHQLPLTANEYNRYLTRPINGTYYRIFAHLDKVDRLWEIEPAQE